MFETDALVEKLLVGEIPEFILILHFNLDDLRLLDVLEANVVLGEVDVRNARVVLEVLTEDKQVFAVQALVLEVKFLELVGLNVVERHVATIYRQALNSVLKDKLSKVLETELVHL